MGTLLTPRDVDRRLIYPAGRAQRLAKAGLLPHIVLPDGSIRFDQADIERLLAELRKARREPALA